MQQSEEIDFSVMSDGEGPLVVMVMGMANPGYVWYSDHVTDIEEAGYRVVTFDNRGSGVSTELTEDFTLEDMVQDLVNIVENEGEPARLVGTGLGSRLILEVMAQRPDLVVGAVTAAPYCRLTRVQRIVADWEYEAQSLIAPEHPNFWAAFKAMKYVSPTTLMDDKKAQEWMTNMYSSLGDYGPGQITQSCVDRGVDRSDVYKNISKPVLLLEYGENHEIYSALVQEVAEVIPGSKHVVLENVGHFGYMERPDEFNRIVIDFLNSLEK